MLDRRTKSCSQTWLQQNQSTHEAGRLRRRIELHTPNETQDERRRTRPRFARSENVEVISKVARMTAHRSLHCLVRPSVLTRTVVLDNDGPCISYGSAPVTSAVSQPLYQTALWLSRASNFLFRQPLAPPERPYLYRLRKPRRLQYQGYSI
jgi:hypothetical protein